MGRNCAFPSIILREVLVFLIISQNKHRPEGSKDTVKILPKNRRDIFCLGVHSFHTRQDDHRDTPWVVLSLVRLREPGISRTHRSYKRVLSGPREGRPGLELFAAGLTVTSGLARRCSTNPGWWGRRLWRRSPPVDPHRGCKQPG